MKKVEQFKCDFCGTLYASKEACFECESQHVVAFDIVSHRHMPKHVSAKYPPRIEV